MYTSNVPEYLIDLALPEEERWAGVIRKERKVARAVFEAGLRDFEEQIGLDPKLKLLRVLTTAAGRPFNAMYQLFGGRYPGEMRAWARALGASAGEVALANCTYELTHALKSTDWKWYQAKKPFGCTAGIVDTERHGPVHVRSMDWSLESIGNATRLFRFRDGLHEFVAVGIAGHVAVLSGMVPGSYSVTINYAPPEGWSFDFGPGFLLREVLETCRTYREAVAVLRDTNLAASVFFVVCGTNAGEACVIERTRKEAAIRRMRGGPLVQGNHYVSRKFTSHNDIDKDAADDGISLFDESCQRASALEEALATLPATADLDRIASCLDVEPVFNDDSFQQMLFVPRSGTVRAWRWVE